jgi:ADP-ribose pyrophosphatase YjhB (NUDIX family)
LEKEILKIARRIQSLAQAGLHYCDNNFDRQRYDELRELSVNLASLLTDADVNTIRDLFTFENGFQTPKVDIRAVVLKEDKILLSRERSDGRFSIPGGFADINYSPSEVAVKEVKEETGLTVKINRLLAIVDTDRHNFPPLEFHYYKIVILCDLVGGELRDNDETTDANFFDFDDLPELSEQRNTTELFNLIRENVRNGTYYLD